MCCIRHPPPHTSLRPACLHSACLHSALLHLSRTRRALVAHCRILATTGRSTTLLPSFITTPHLFLTTCACSSQPCSSTNPMYWRNKPIHIKRSSSHAVLNAFLTRPTPAQGEEDQDPFVPINNCSSSEWATLIAEEVRGDRSPKVRSSSRLAPPRPAPSRKHLQSASLFSTLTLPSRCSLAKRK